MFRLKFFKHKKKIQGLSLTIFIILLTSTNLPIATQAQENENNSSLIKGYITNKVYDPMKLKVFEIDKESFYTSERNLEDNSLIPHLDLMITAENTLDYLLPLDEQSEDIIFVPASTKFVGYISEIIPPKKFDRKGFFKVTFDKAICPNGETINLQKVIISKSQEATYNPIKHLGKTTAGLLGGSLVGALLAFQFGGLPLAVSSHGYSIAAGAAAGGFLGTVGSVVSKGKNSQIEPGSRLTVRPVDQIGLSQLKQINCESKKEEIVEITKNIEIEEKIKIEIISVKEKKNLMGDNIIKVKIKFTNDSKDLYRLSNFLLRDSQGKEYTTSFLDLDDDILRSFPPQETTAADLNFFVDHPKASHWLVLKDKNYTSEIREWKLDIN